MKSCHPDLCPGMARFLYATRFDGYDNKANEKHFGLRVDGSILAKFRCVCGFHGRSANAQIIQLMLKFIADYEAEPGEIELE